MKCATTASLGSTPFAFSSVVCSVFCRLLLLMWQALKRGWCLEARAFVNYEQQNILWLLPLCCEDAVSSRLNYGRDTGHGKLKGCNITLCWWHSLQWENFRMGNGVRRKSSAQFLLGMRTSTLRLCNHTKHHVFIRANRQTEYIYFVKLISCRRIKPRYNKKLVIHGNLQLFRFPFKTWTT